MWASLMFNNVQSARLEDEMKNARLPVGVQEKKRMYQDPRAWKSVLGKDKIWKNYEDRFLNSRLSEQPLSVNSSHG